MIKRVAVLGSTGSIGQQTLEIIRAFPDKLQAYGLAIGRNTALLQEQVAEFKPRLISTEATIEDKWPGVEYVSLREMASHPEVDLVVVATSGKAGLEPTLAAIAAGKGLALANKEVLVAAGEIVTAEVCRRGVTILPIDSEHSALWQCLRGEEHDRVARLILTASGGPFRDKTPQEMAAITPEQALSHPTWKMGRKVTIDSATLMNKGLEVIEAHWLFAAPFPQIEVVIHPQSIIHSMVEFSDGSTKAQLSLPDMRLPIQYALSYPERWLGPFKYHLDVAQPGRLDFAPVDWDKFPCLRLAIEAGRQGGTYPAVLSAADEVAVDLFLSKRIGFTDIAALVAKTLEKHQSKSDPTLDDILAADAWAREIADAWI